MLDISLGLLLFVAALFLALVYLLNNMLYQPLLAFMDKREKSIQDDLATSDQNSEEIEAAMTEANDKISVAKSEAAKIREEAMSKAKEAAASKIEESKSALESQYSAFVDQLAKDKVSLKESISANLSSYQDGIQAKIKNI
ncbi:MAG: F0F1 ATP synthase subunit B' [Epsilonproteobacteria bacterium]|nr:F0F1 ATP synthase subunit B' [Campylobacterota bacterium]